MVCIGQPQTASPFLSVYIIVKQMDKAQVHIIRNMNKTLTVVYYRIKTGYNLELKYFQNIDEIASRVEKHII